jgi:hypothetical protein
MAMKWLYSIKYPVRRGYQLESKLTHIIKIALSGRIDAMLVSVDRKCSCERYSSYQNKYGYFIALNISIYLEKYFSFPPLSTAAPSRC